LTPPHYSSPKGRKEEKKEKRGRRMGLTMKKCKNAKVKKAREAYDE